MYSDDWLLLGGFAAVVLGIGWLCHPGAGLIVLGVGLVGLALLPRTPKGPGAEGEDRRWL